MSGPNELRYTQNFLKSRALVEKIVDLAEIGAGMTVLEIGPGKGIITRELGKRVGETGRVVAVELDAELSAELRTKFRASPQVTIVQQDILQFDRQRLGQNYHVVSNIPFNITSDLLTFLLNLTNGATTAHLILQRDAIVGQDKGGNATETFKSLLIKPLYAVAIAHDFSKADFSPRPSVETALFAFKQLAEPLIDVADYALYADFLAFVSKDRVGEGAWRKLFSKRQLAALPAVAHGRGLKSQSFDGMVGAFELFLNANKSKHKIVAGMLHQLRDEQQRRLKINRAGGHHRSKSSGRSRRR